jgi:hypothetical protein
MTRGSEATPHRVFVKRQQAGRFFFWSALPKKKKIQTDKQ